jgi:hypothetical protein
MNESAPWKVGLAAGAWVVALAACGGGAKQASAPGNCPEGSSLQGDTCVPETAQGAPASGGESGSPKASTNSMPSSGGGSDTANVDHPTYDKDAVDLELKRAAKQIKDNCGSATNEDGVKAGPWGSTTATLVLGRNGHVADVTVPSPYSGKPVGECVVRSFKKIQFPPYAGANDVTVTWDVEIKEPKNK